MLTVSERIGDTFISWYAIFEHNTNKLIFHIILFSFAFIFGFLTFFFFLGTRLPLYSEAKLAIFIYLWHPKTKARIWHLELAELFCLIKLYIPNIFFDIIIFNCFQGTSYVYNSFFRPYIAKHEGEIDHILLELRDKAGDIAILYWQKAVSFGQTRFFEILQYVSSQSASWSKSDKVSIDKEK